MANERACDILQSLLLHYLQAGVVVHGPDSGILLANEEAERFLGLTTDQLLGKSAMDPAWTFVREDGSVMPVEEYPVHRVLTTRQSFRGQVVGVNRPSCGDQVWGLTNAFPEYDADGALQRIIVTFVDITERRQAEERQRHLTEVLRAIRNVNQLITQEKDQGTLLQRACDLLTESRGYHTAWIALRGKDGMLTIGGHSGLASGLEPLRARLASGVVPFCCLEAVEGSGLLHKPDTARGCKGCPLAGSYDGASALACRLRHDQHDGGVLVVSLPSTAAADQEEQSLFCEVAGDLALALSALASEREHQAALQALQKSESRFRTLVEHAPEAIFIQAGGRFAYMNPAAVALFGARDEMTLVGEPVLDRFHPDIRGQVAERIKRLNEQGQAVARAEERILRLDGSEKVAEFSAVPFDYAGERGALVFARDVTERKEAEAERERLQVQLSQAQKLESIGQLAGGVAHDFNNMLGVILGHSELALDIEKPSDPLRTHLQQIRHAAQHSADLTRQLLAFARKQTIAPRILDINAAVGDLLQMLKRLIGEHIDLAWMPQAEAGRVKMDPSQLDQILANLCVNARDAIGEKGKITIETAAVAFDEAYCGVHAGFVPGDYVLLAVSDDGRGMDRETQARLFEPFFTTKGPGKGTGLGLATVYGIVRQNHGFINVYSEPEQGSTFRIYLPRHLARTEVAPPPPAASKQPRQHGTILLVEDEPSLLTLTQRLLELQGYQVLAAATAGEAIQLAESHVGAIDLLLTDVVMPEMNGRELAKNILKVHPGLKRLFMSGYTSNVIAHHGILDEGVHFLQKPFALADLSASVRQALGG
jgi:PAS domain S-box-containing protein